MSSRPTPQALDELPPSRLCSFNVDMRFRLNIDIRLTRSGKRRPQAPPPPYSESKNMDMNLISGSDRKESAVKQGPVRMREYGAYMQGWVLMNWLVLTDNHLALHVSAVCSTEPGTIVTDF